MYPAHFISSSEHGVRHEENPLWIVKMESGVGRKLNDVVQNRRKRIYYMGVKVYLLKTFKTTQKIENTSFCFLLN